MNYGIRSVQSILKEATQSNLSFFHVSGNIESTVLKPSISEVLRFTKRKNVSSSVTIKPEHRNIVKEVVGVKLSDLLLYIIDSTIIDVEWETKYWKKSEPNTIRLYFDMYKAYEYGITLKDIAKTISGTKNISPEFLGIVEIEQIYIETFSFEDIIVGSKFITDSALINGTTLKMNGSSIYTMYNLIDKIEFDTFTTNDIMDIYINFGIESAREKIKDLLGGSESAGFIADFMTRSGEVLAINKKSIKLYERGFISWAFFEGMSLTLKSTIDKQYDYLDNVYSKIFVGDF